MNLSEFSISFSRKARKGLLELNERTQLLVEEAIDTLKTDPVPIKQYGVKKLFGSESDYRIRIGQYRIQYTIYQNEKAIVIFYISRRLGNTYK